MANEKMTEVDAQMLVKNNQSLAKAYKKATPNKEDQMQELKQALLRIKRQRASVGGASDSSAPGRGSDEATNEKLTGICDKHGRFIVPRCIHCTDDYLLQFAKDLEREDEAG